MFGHFCSQICSPPQISNLAKTHISGFPENVQNPTVHVLDTLNMTPFGTPIWAPSGSPYPYPIPHILYPIGRAHPIPLQRAPHLGPHLGPHLAPRLKPLFHLLPPLFIKNSSIIHHLSRPQIWPFWAISHLPISIRGGDQPSDPIPPHSPCPLIYGILGPQYTPFGALPHPLSTGHIQGMPCTPYPSSLTAHGMWPIPHLSSPQ